MIKPKILILFYSRYGHTYEMAKAIASGVEAVGGEVCLKRVAEMLPEEKLDEYAQKALDSMRNIPVADPAKDLEEIDGVIIGTPTWFGNMAYPMKYFWDQTGEHFTKGTLVGKPAGAFTSSGAQHGGQEMAIVNSLIVLLHHGCVIVGLPNSCAGQDRVDEVSGGTPYGVSTITGEWGQRMASDNERKLAKDYGMHFTKIAQKLKEV